MSDAFFTEYFYYKSLGFTAKIKKLLHSEESPWQKIDVYETERIGKLLTLNGKTMVSELDEFVYHEVLAHVSYAVARQHRRVLIIGGGDGGVVREFVKHPDIEQIDLVEIDERVVEVSKIYFPECTVGLSDPRVRVLCEDGIKFIEEKIDPGSYDIVIIDSTDPEEMAEGLFTDRFYKAINRALSPEGIMLAQTENPFLDEFGLKKIYDNLRAAFPSVESFTAPIIIYPGAYWSFAFASKKFRGTDLNPHKQAQMQKLQQTLRWYNMDWHRGAFALSNFHRKQIGQE
ncbi:MAG: polyamine aminopropyltransferase [Oligoflexia bacterium]|nr:polyamine aminopropyltransferase [Oligoflexia bacterium]MBF0365878.1 polyamine aminopropyltransferase [Oligoflexia bacterium]